MPNPPEVDRSSLGHPSQRWNIIKAGIAFTLAFKLTSCDSQASSLDSPEGLLPPNLCQTKGTICRLETDPNNPDIGELTLQFQTPKNHTWIMDSLSRVLLSQKIDFNKFQLNSNFTTGVTAPSSSDKNLWEQEIHTGLLRSFKYDVYSTPVDDQKVPVVMIKTKKNHWEPIELTKFLEIIDHPFSQHIPETEEEKADYPEKYQTATNQVASLYPTEHPYTHSLSSETTLTFDQTFNTIFNSKDLEKDQLVIVNNQVIFDILDDQSQAIGRIMIPEKDWPEIQEAFKAQEEKLTKPVGNPCVYIPVAITALGVIIRIIHGASTETNRRAGVQRGMEEAQQDKKERIQAARRETAKKAAKEKSDREWRADQDRRKRRKMTPFF